MKIYKIGLAIRAAWAILWGHTVVVNATFVDGVLQLKTGICADSTFMDTNGKPAIVVESA